MLAGIRSSISNLFLQDTAIFATDKRKSFVNDIFTRQEIFSNKDFLLRLVCHYVLLLGRNKRQNNSSKSIILSHYEELGITWLFQFYFVEKYVTCFHVLGRNQLFLSGMHWLDKKNLFLLSRRAVFRCRDKNLQEK